MADSNVTLVGNLTKDPELRYTNAQKPYVSFSIAINRKWDGGEQTSYFDCVSWSDLALHVSESFNKGDRIIVVGRLEQRIWEAPDGAKRSKIECVATDVGASVRWNNATLNRGERGIDVFDTIKTAVADNNDYF